MPGFTTNANDVTKQVLYADNVDFSGGDPVVGKVTTNGQLLIGSTIAPNIRVNTLTAGTGIIVTNGAGTITVASTASSTDLHVAKYIVSGDGTSGTGANYTTIASAIAAAVSSGVNSTVFVQPGTYTENFTLPANINLTAFDCDANTPNVTIVGKITCSDAGSRSISGIRLQTNSDNCLAVTGSAATTLYLIECYINCSNNTGISYTSSGAGSSINIFECKGNITTTGIALFSSSSLGLLKFINCHFLNSGNSTTNSTISAGLLFCATTFFACPITTSGTNGITSFDNCFIATNPGNTTCMTVGGSGQNTINNSSFNSGSATAISVSVGAALGLLSSSVASTNTNAIAGAGTVKIGTVGFYNTSSTVSTTTQIPWVSSNDAIKVVTPGAYPYTTTAQDAIILVDTSSARTITPYASPVTGQRHIIKDSVGSAAANVITITPSGKNIDGAASYVISNNYGSITIVFNGTEWNII